MQKKIWGFVLILVGLLALLTPLTPGSWLIFAGLELIGVRLLFVEKIKAWLGFQSKPQTKKTR